MTKSVAQINSFVANTKVAQDLLSQETEKKFEDEID